MADEVFDPDIGRYVDTADALSRPNAYDAVVRLLDTLGLEPDEVRKGGIRLVEHGGVQLLEVDVWHARGQGVFDTRRWPVTPPDPWHDLVHQVHRGPSDG